MSSQLIVMSINKQQQCRNFQLHQKIWNLNSKWEFLWNVSMRNSAQLYDPPPVWAFVKELSSTLVPQILGTLSENVPEKYLRLLNCAHSLSFFLLVLYLRAPTLSYIVFKISLAGAVFKSMLRHIAVRPQHTAEVRSPKFSII